MRGRILIVDDERGMCEVLAEGLGKRGFSVAWRDEPEDGYDALRTLDFDAFVFDLNMRGLNGLDLCARAVAERPEVPAIIITAFASLESAVQAIRAGAYDFLTKPLRLDALAIALDRAVEHRRLKDEVRRLRIAAAQIQSPAGLIGESPKMRTLGDLIGRVAGSEANVLVQGETGSGKEVVARALHTLGRRAEGPFVAINCAAMPEALLESELFGHVRGAFTDARQARQGLFFQAAGGTLFLDEIGDMPVALQAKLLRAVEQRSVRPVGGDRDLPFDARIVSATHRDLDEAAEQGRFRRDLYFRLNVIQIELPPLRARGADTLLLAQHFLERAAGRASGTRAELCTLSSAAAARLLAYDWPGNVRELANCMERAVALASGPEIRVEDLPERIRRHEPRRFVVEADGPAALLTLDELERRYILQTLETLGGNKRLAARTLGLDRRTLYRKLERYGVALDGPDTED